MDSVQDFPFILVVVRCGNVKRKCRYGYCKQGRLTCQELYCLNSRYIILIDLNSPVTYQKWVMAATMDPLGIQGGTLLASMSVHTPSIMTRLVQR